MLFRSKHLAQDPRARLNSDALCAGNCDDERGLCYCAGHKTPFQRSLPHVCAPAVTPESKLPDGRPLLGNGLLVLTDDILLYAVDETDMLVILNLFLTTVAQHKMKIHPGKCVFCSRSAPHTVDTESLEKA